MTSVRHLLALVLVVLAAAIVAAECAACARGRVHASAAPSRYVVDGDTLDVRLDNGRSERVRLIGIDTPERGDCLAARPPPRRGASPRPASRPPRRRHPGHA